MQSINQRLFWSVSISRWQNEYSKKFPYSNVVELDMLFIIVGIQSHLSEHLWNNCSQFGKFEENAKQSSSINVCKDSFQIYFLNRLLVIQISFNRLHLVNVQQWESAETEDFGLILLYRLVYAYNWLVPVCSYGITVFGFWFLALLKDGHLKSEASPNVVQFGKELGLTH